MSFQRGFFNFTQLDGVENWIGKYLDLRECFETLKDFDRNS